MRTVHLAAAVLTLAFVGSSSGQEVVPGQEVRPPEASPGQARSPFDKALARATVHNKRVIALFVDEGQDLAAAWKKNRSISRTLLYEFEIVQFAGEQADARAMKLGWPEAVQSKPAAVVLDGSGKHLARLSAADLATEGEDACAAFLARLKPHFAVPVDAEKKLAVALVEARKSGRKVFVRFDAPW